MWDFLLWVKRAVILLALAWAGVQLAPPKSPAAPDRPEAEKSRPSACLQQQRLAASISDSAPLV